MNIVRRGSEIAMRAFSARWQQEIVMHYRLLADGARPWSGLCRGIYGHFMSSFFRPAT
jgi:hypothetical protein